jgi:hypothetical protein
MYMHVAIYTTIMQLFLHGQNFDNVCLGHLFTYRDFQGD